MSEAFGATLRHYRERLHLSQSTLARRAGYDHSYQSRLESGARMPTREAVERLAAALALEPGERDALLHAAGFVAGDGAVLLPLADFRAWLDEGMRLLARAEGN